MTTKDKTKQEAPVRTVSLAELPKPFKTYAELRRIDVGANIEKKNGLSFLSWTHALDHLLIEDPNANWSFGTPVSYGETLMVFCTVEAFGKSRTMHLPVMDSRGQAIKNPDARRVSDAMVRCLAKTIATFGIGLYVYAGSDLPDDEPAGDPLEQLIDAMNNSTNLEELRASYQAAFAQARNNRAAVDRLAKIKDQLKTNLEGKQ